MADESNEARLCDEVAVAVLRSSTEVTVTVPDKVIRDAFLELYRERHPGVPLPRVVIKAKE
ncbi:MAG: hypothetical protein ACYTEX_27580 [Planctomycetota bacterium]|jgi:hypothetical protein